MNLNNNKEQKERTDRCPICGNRVTNHAPAITYHMKCMMQNMKEHFDKMNVPLPKK